MHEARTPGRIVTARWLVTGSSVWLDGGGVHVARGRVSRVLSTRAAVRRAGLRVLDLGDAIVAPGFVNAHAHLELSGLSGSLPAGESFTRWIRALLERKAALSRDEGLRAAREGADRLLRAGSTAVGDIDSTELTDTALARHPLRRRVYREVLDARDPRRTGGAIDRASTRRARRARVLEGLAPHAPYTVSESLFRELGRRARRTRSWTTIHWAETREEVEWLADGTGPLSAILADAPRLSGLDAIEAAGLLGERTSLVHGNHPEAGDLGRVARAGATLVHCPGTHAFFGRDPFDFEATRRAGVTVALGTDGLASNLELDMRREMRLLRACAPELSPALVWDMATRHGARAIGLSGRVGEISAGAYADFCAHELPGVDLSRSRPDELLDALTSGRSTVRAAWIGGRTAFERKT